jgi:hypothetical protein
MAGFAHVSGVCRLVLSLCCVAQLTSVADACSYPPGIIGSPPSQPFVVLGKGRIAGNRWDSLLFHRKDGICTELALDTESLVVCGQLSPLAVSLISGTGRSGKEATAISLVALSRVKSVRLIFTGRPSETAYPKELGQQRGRQAQVSPSLRVFARAYQGPFCLSRYIAYNQAHQVVFTSFEHACDE